MERRYKRVPDWLYFFGVLPAAALLPRKWAYRLVRRQGSHFYNCQAIHRASVIQSLQQVFDTFTPGSRDLTAIARGTFESLAFDDFEAYYFNSWNPANIDRYFKFEGLEHLERAMSQDRGVLLFTAHLGSPCSAVVAMSLKGYPLYHLVNDSPANTHFPAAFRSYARLKIKWMERRMGRRFILFRLDANSADSASAAMQAYRMLSEKQLVSMAIDVPPVWVGNKARTTFLGRRCLFPTGLVQLANLANVPVLPYFSIRDSAEPMRQTLVIQEPISLQGDLSWDLQSCIERLQQVIRDHPDQWLLWDSFETFRDMESGSANG